MKVKFEAILSVEAALEAVKEDGDALQYVKDQTEAVCLEAVKSSVGYLAIGELDGVPYLQLCENRPYDCLDAAEIDRLVLEIGGTGDEMERRMSAGGDLL